MSGISVPNLLGGGDMLSSSLNSQLAASMYQAMANAERENRGVPDSTRRAFLSGMDADARVARMGSQNMGDAEGMLSIAQSGMTGMKQSLTNMFELSSDIAGTILTTPEQFQAFRDTMEDMLDNMMGFAGGLEFNGYKLMDGSKPSFSLSAGGSQIDADMFNVLDTSLDDKVISGNGKSINLEALRAHIAGITDIDGAREFGELLTGLIDFSSTAVGALSSDIKNVNNLSTLLESQADIFDNVQKNHQDPDQTVPDPESSADLLQSLINSNSSTGNIFSGAS